VGCEKGPGEIEDVSGLSQSASRMEPLFPKEQIPASFPYPRDAGTTLLSINGCNLCFRGKLPRWRIRLKRPKLSSADSFWFGARAKIAHVFREAHSGQSADFFLEKWTAAVTCV
jgi:hypothetical protein